LIVFRSANLAVKFLLELGAIAAFAYWGATVAGGWDAVVLAVAAPAVAVALWGQLAAPRARRRLPLAARVPFELAVFGLAAASLYAAAGRRSAVLFGLLVAVNSVLLTVFRQWES
jgi:hypothetical protein